MAEKGKKLQKTISFVSSVAKYEGVYDVGNIRVFASDFDRTVLVRPCKNLCYFSLGLEEARQMSMRLFEQSLSKEEAREVSQALMFALQEVLREDKDDYFFLEKINSSKEEKAE